VTLSSFAETHQHVTDRQTDGTTDRITMPIQRCNYIDLAKLS